MVEILSVVGTLAVFVWLIWKDRSAELVGDNTSLQSPCGDCGLCCMHMGAPPYDRSEVALLPSEVRFSLESVRLSRQLQYKTHGTEYTPCGWFDMETRRCKRYEYRPAVCRDFEPGCVYCNNLRTDAGLVQISIKE
jgi:Fe-S-cluster containining protein